MSLASPDECGQMVYQAALYNNVDLLQGTRAYLFDRVCVFARRAYEVGEHTEKKHTRG